MQKTLVWGAVACLAALLICCIVFGIVAGGNGAISAALGVAMGFVFLGITASSVLVANRFFGTDLYVPIFFATVLGAWIVKFAIFILVALILKAQAWIDTPALFLSMIVAILVSLVVDVVVISRSRMLFASDVKLPGDTR